MNDLMYWIMPTKSSLMFLAVLFMIISLFTPDTLHFLYGVICWCAAGIMAHD